MLLVNAFSFNMVPAELSAGTIRFHQVTTQEASDAFAGGRSAVGHAPTADLFASILGREVACARETISLVPGQSLILGQYVGPRLPEGATSLPAGATVRWYLISL